MSNTWIDKMNKDHNSTTEQTHKKYWRTKQVCERFGEISSRTLSRWISSRGFPPSVTPDGEANLYSIDAVVAWEEKYFKG